MEKIYHCYGNKDSEWIIKENSKLYNFLDKNYYIIRDDTEEKIIIYEETLDDLLNTDEEFSDEENSLIGALLYHLEYFGGYIFS